MFATTLVRKLSGLSRSALRASAVAFPRALSTQAVAPLIEQHRHLEGAVRLSTLQELGASNLELLAPLTAGTRYANVSPKDFMDNDFAVGFFCTTERSASLKHVLDAFMHTQMLLSSDDIVERITFEACEDAYNDGICALELRYSPQFVCLSHPWMTSRGVHEAVLRGVERAKDKYPIAVALIGIIDRCVDEPVAWDALDFIVSNRDTFAAIDLANDEAAHPAKPFAPMFMKIKAKNAGLRVTVHSGEVVHPDSHQWVKDAIEHLGAERIGHGIQLAGHPDTINFVKEKKIPLEVSVTSNFICNGIGADITDHPIRKLMESGLDVTINSDDPGIFHYEDFLQCQKTAVRTSFIPEIELRRVLPAHLFE